MAKYNGYIGYKFDDVEIRPGVYGEEIIEKEVFGDTKRIYEKNENSGQVNDSININIQVSIIADQYAMNNLHRIKYATYGGTKWKVTSAEPCYPRMLLTLGGVYYDK